jgi:hypothetical protein
MQGLAIDHGDAAWLEALEDLGLAAAIASYPGIGQMCGPRR